MVVVCIGTRHWIDEVWEYDDAEPWQLRVGHKQMQQNFMPSTVWWYWQEKMHRL